MTIRRILCAVLGSTMLMLSPSFATLVVNDLQLDMLDLFGGSIFSSPGTTYNGEFSFFEDLTSSSSSEIGQFKVEGDSDYLYRIKGGIVRFTPSELLEDQSASYGMPVGFFNSGGTLTVEGTIWKIIDDAGTQVQVLGYTTVLEASIKDLFALYSSYPGENALYAQFNMDVTGGAFAAGSGSGFVISDVIQANPSFYNCSQAGGDVADFSQNIAFSGLDSIVQIYPVPEPLTITLLGLGALGLLRRSR